MTIYNKKTIAEIEQKQATLYSELLTKYAGTAMATSSESNEHKILRFSCIDETLKNDNNFTIHDIGCGLAQFYDFLKNKYPQKIISYAGTEIVPEYIEFCRAKYPNQKFYLRNVAKEKPQENYDYTVMSGVFHQIRDTKRKDWELFMQNLIKNAFASTQKALIFNVISPFVDFYQTNVYYCNLAKLLNFINDDLSRFWNIKQNYPLFEMTISVYNTKYIQSQYKQEEFVKYFGEK